MLTGTKSKGTNMNDIILASASPRRIEMMRSHGFDPRIIPADVDENLPAGMSPESSVMYLAFKKACHVSGLVFPASDKNSSGQAAKTTHEKPRHGSENALIIAADTVVVFEDDIIGKPASEKDAYDILRSMSEKCHHVMTGVCVLEISDGQPTKKTCLCEDTAVYFKNYSDEELLTYVRTDEPYDKAGGYAIQGTFGKYVDHIEGDFDNVVGFPWKRIEPFLKDR